MRSRRRLLRRGDLRLVAAIAATIAFAVMLNQPSSVSRLPTWSDTNLLRLNLPSPSILPRPDDLQVFPVMDSLSIAKTLPQPRRENQLMQPLLPTALPAPGQVMIPRLASKRLYFWGDRAALAPSENGPLNRRQAYATATKFRIP